MDGRHRVAASVTVTRRPGDWRRLAMTLLGIAALVALFHWLAVTNTTTVALLLLVVVLWTATTSGLWVAVVSSFAAVLALNYFFMAPVGTLSLVDPQNWI